MGRIKVGNFSEDPSAPWQEVHAMALLGLPESCSLRTSSLEAVAALPAGTAICAELEAAPSGCLTASLRQLERDGRVAGARSLLALIAPLIAPGVRLRPGQGGCGRRWQALAPLWSSSSRSAVPPGPRAGQLEPTARLPVPPGRWPWDLERALAVLAANGGGSLRLTVRHLRRSARIERSIAELHAELVAASYAAPDRRDLLDGLTACRAMREAPALLGFEVALTGERPLATVRNLVALALFGTLAGEDADDPEDDLRLLAGSTHAPTRLVPSAEEGARLTAGAGAPSEASDERDWIVAEAAGAPVRLSPQDRERHLYVIGATGTGKSTLLKALIRQDMRAGEGVILIDPHGDIAREMAAEIEAEHPEALTYADAADPNGRFAIDLLPDTSDSTAFEIAADMLVAIFRETLYDGVRDAFGPVFELYFRNSLGLLTAAEPEERRLANLPRIFEERAFRNDLLTRCGNQAVTSFWKQTATRTSGDHDLVNITPYIVAKLTRLIASDHARSIFPAAGRGLDFAAAMASGRIVILRCPKGALGEGLAELAMSACLMQIRAAAMARAASDQRRPVRLYVDEFQGCRGSALQTLLAEGRKFGISLVLANQSLGQIGGATHRSVGAATLANVGNLIAFRVGAADALLLAPWFDHPERWRELCRLPDFTMQARLLERGRPINLSGLSIPGRGVI